jgi:hypothetical protein
MLSNADNLYQKIDLKLPFFWFKLFLMENIGDRHGASEAIYRLV